MKKILIVTYNFPPNNAMGSRRWAEMIPYLSKHYEIYVFTTFSDGDLSVDLSESRIKRVGFNQNTLLKKDFKTPLYHKIISKLTHEIRSIDSTWIHWYYKNRDGFKEFFNSVDPDYLITTVGPYSSALFGKNLKKRNRKCRWILDIRDPASLYHEYRKNWFEQRLDEIMDKYICHTADLIIATVGNITKEKLEVLYKKEIFQIFNGFNANLYPIISTSKRSASNQITIYYAGRIYEHRFASFLLLCESIKNLNARLIIRLMADKDEFEKIHSTIKTRKYCNVQLLDPTDAATVLEESKSADILLLLESLELKSDSDLGVLPGKLFENLIYEAPILAICSKKSAINSVLNETGRGLVVETKSQIRDFLSKYKTYTLKNVEQIQKYSRQYQAEKLIDLIRSKFEQ
jgi:hypothetical protein